MISKLLVGRVKALPLGINPVRTYANTATCPVEHTNETTELPWARAAPYSRIPGPSPVPVFGNVIKFMPYIGKYGNLPLCKQMQCLHDDFGDIVRLEGLPSRRSTVFLFNPDHCERMYRLEGPWPERLSLETMRLYRERFTQKTYRGRFGLVSSQGKEWAEFRTNVNQHMMAPRSIKPHVGQVDGVANDFITRIRKLRDPKTLKLPPTFNNEMNKWALESICMIALDHRLGGLDSNLPKDSEPQQMIDAVHELFECLYQLEILPSLWRHYDTPYLKRLFTALDLINRISRKHIDAAKLRYEKNPQSDRNHRSVLESLLSIDVDTAYVMAIDMLTAGIDTSGNTAGNLLYYLSAYPRVQNKVREEILSVLPDKSAPVTYEALNNIPYLKACIKESLRFAPVAIGNLRTMHSDIVVGGYQIPKGTDLIACHGVLAISSDQFSRENEFVPERWLRDSDDSVIVRSSKEAHRFAYMPFGFGPRMCIGRRFAELEMEVLAIKMLQNFILEWPSKKPLEIKSRFINTIASPLELKLTDR